MMPKQTRFLGNKEGYFLSITSYICECYLIHNINSFKHLSLIYQKNEMDINFTFEPKTIQISTGRPLYKAIIRGCCGFISNLDPNFE